MPHSILVVDDEPDLLEVIGLELELAGFTVHKAINGTKALEIIRSSSIDIVLSDIRMPNGDGLDLLDAMMQERRFTPSLVFMSGYSDCDEEQAFHRGAVGYFHKPLVMGKLMSTLLEYAEPPAKRWKKVSEREPMFHVIGSAIVGQKSLPRVDLGRGGFYAQVEGGIGYRIAQPVSFNIEVGPSEQISGEGTIRWLRRAEAKISGLGIEIASMSEESILLFEAHIKAQGMRAYIPLG